MSHGGGSPVLDTVSAPFKYLEKFGVNTKLILVFFGILMVFYMFTFLDLGSNKIFGIIFATAPIWLPWVTFHLFYEYWLEYVQKEFVVNYGRTTVEIKLPQEIFKSPEAMELVMNQFYQTASPDNHIETYIDGKHPPTTSLEIVSRGGDVRFYINMPRKRYKDLYEAQLYAHYPGIEVHQLDIDYASEIKWDPSKYAYFGLHFGLKEHDAYPIKTYIEYGLDKLPKEEEKIDPINTMLEMLGSINPDEHIWIQILITANKKKTFKEGVLHDTPDWKADARAKIKDIIETAVKERSPDGEMKGNIMMLLTDAEKDTIKAIERTLGKLAFNTIIRSMYIMPKDKVRIGDIVPRIITAWRAYDDINRNAIGVKWRTDYDWNWWQDPSGRKRLGMKEHELYDYKRRILHPQAGHYGTCIMTTEELATIYHFPGKVATTPSLARIPSKRSEPPPNLPVG